MEALFIMNVHVIIMNGRTGEEMLNLRIKIQQLRDKMEETLVVSLIHITFYFLPENLIDGVLNINKILVSEKKRIEHRRTRKTN